MRRTDYSDLSGYTKQDTDERYAIALITSFKESKYLKSDLQLFYNLLSDPVGYEGIKDYKGYYLGTNLLRSEFNLRRNGRPGDFDIIFIPYNNDRLLYERTAVFEVKIARPHFHNANKGPNSLGESQIKGLIEDGFPLIGLIHLCMPHPLKKEQLIKIKTGKVPINVDLDADDNEMVNLDDCEYENFDWLPMHAVRVQMRKMIRKEFPKYVAINAFAMTQSEDGTHNILTSLVHRGFISGYFSPHTSDETISCIESHFLKYGDERYRKLEF